MVSPRLPLSHFVSPRFLSAFSLSTVLLLVSGCSIGFVAQSPRSEAPAGTVAIEPSPVETATEKSFPADVGWIDIKRDYGAKGDGKTDDTAAIHRALQAPYSDFTRPKIIYFPAGTYLVSQTLQFPTGRNRCCVTFQGQGQGQTVIRLRDQARGFGDVSVPQAVIRTTQGNMAFRNYVRDLTIDTGRSNPGAIGIDYVSNNRGAVKDVTIRSGDGAGVAGLSMTREWPGPNLIKRLTVEGFDYGIEVAQPIYGVTLEKITLRGQRQAGMLNQANILAIRGLDSTNRVPVLQNGKREGITALRPLNALAIVLDGQFRGGDSGSSAIENQAYLYARNIEAEGYRSAIVNQGQVVTGLSQTEYLSHQPYRLFGNATQSLQLPIEETPDFHDNNLNNWANVADYPTLQDAMNSGKSTIYFPQGQYTLNENITIPATVQKIIGFEALLRGPQRQPSLWRISDPSNQPLVIEGLVMRDITLEHRSPRTLSIQHTQLKNRRGPAFENAQGAGKLFLEDVQVDLHLDFPQQVWARQLNAESLDETRTKVSNRGGTLWILGIKTEGKGPVLETSNGGKTELLGTLVYPVKVFEGQELEQAAFINRESSQSLIYGVSAARSDRMYRIQVEETQNDVKRQFLTDDMPGRVMPLFVGEQAN